MIPSVWNDDKYNDKYKENDKDKDTKDKISSPFLLKECPILLISFPARIYQDRRCLRD